MVLYWQVVVVVRKAQVCRVLLASVLILRNAKPLRDSSMLLTPYLRYLRNLLLYLKVR